jgi:hypothetical protein
MPGLAIVSLLSLTCLVNTINSQECKCRAPEPGATTRTGYSEELATTDEIPHKSVRGVVHLLGHDEPMEGVLIELFTLPARPPGRPPQKQRRLKACITEADGRFCFKGIAKGWYELRASKEGGFEITHVEVFIDPKNPESTDRGIDVPVVPGK